MESLLSACQLSEVQGITGSGLRLRTWSEVVQPSISGSPSLGFPKSRMWHTLCSLSLFHYKISDGCQELTSCFHYKSLVVRSHFFGEGGRQGPSM